MTVELKTIEKEIEEEINPIIKLYYYIFYCLKDYKGKDNYEKEIKQALKYISFNTDDNNVMNKISNMDNYYKKLIKKDVN
jgi:hypothetical protein